MNLIVQLPEAPVIHNEVTGEDTLEPGYVVIGDGYYDVLDGVEVKDTDVIASGDNRYSTLDAAHQGKILEALVNENDGQGGTRTKRIKMDQIKEGDEVLETNIIPHHWFGESLSNLIPNNTLPSQ